MIFENNSHFRVISRVCFRIFERELVRDKYLNNRQTARFCSHLARLLASGMPLLRALESIRRLAGGKKPVGQLEGLIRKVTNGIPFSEAAANFLPALAVGAVKSAERAGNLEETLDYLAKHFEAKAELEDKVKSAMVYPAFILALSLLTVAAVFGFVLPGMKSMFADLGADLPLLTQIIFNSGDWFGRVGWGMALLGACSCKIFFRGPAEDHLLNLPVIGQLNRQELAIQGLGTLGALLKSGTPISEALEVTGDAMPHPTFRKLLLEAKAKVENGEKLSEAFSSSRFFPAEAMEMLKVGEDCGGLAEMLLRIADFEAKEREILLKRLTALIEPALTLSVGLVVGVIALALFLPIMGMLSAIN